MQHRLDVAGVGGGSGLSPLDGASVGNSTEDDESTFKMAHAGGWQVVAGCWVGAQLGPWSPCIRAPPQAA